jgi:four helix bundle protein
MIGLSDDQNVQKLIRHFHDLEVYKKAFAVSLEIHKTSLEFPKIEQYALGDQIRRASKSICANIAEGFAKQQSSKPDFKRFLLIAIGSAHEMLVWIEYCKELGYVPLDQSERWTSEYQSVTRMLQSLHSKI